MADYEGSTSGTDGISELAQQIINVMVGAAGANEQMQEFANGTASAQGSISAAVTLVSQLANQYKSLNDALTKVNNAQGQFLGNGTGKNEKGSNKNPKSNNLITGSESTEQVFKELITAIGQNTAALRSKTDKPDIDKANLSKDAKSEINKNRQNAAIQSSKNLYANQKELEAQINYTTSQYFALAAAAALREAKSNWSKETGFYQQQAQTQLRLDAARASDISSRADSSYWQDRADYEQSLSQQVNQRVAYNDSEEGQKLASDKAAVKSLEAQRARDMELYLSGLSEEERQEAIRVTQQARIIRAKNTIAKDEKKKADELNKESLDTNKFSLSNSFGDSIFFSAKKLEEYYKGRRGLSGLLGQFFGNVFKGRTGSLVNGDVGNKGVEGAGINMGYLIGGGVTAAITTLAKGLQDLGKSALSAYGDIQTLKTNLGVVYGDSSQASMTFNDLAKYAIKSPFGVQQVTEQAVLLKQSGVYESDLLNTLKMIGDMAGGNAQKMERISADYAKIIAADSATQRELRQFAIAGVPIYETLRNQLGIDQKTLRRKTQAGEITASDIQQAFKTMTGPQGTFHNAVEIGSKTYKARAQNLSDSRQLALSSIGQWMYDFGKDRNKGTGLGSGVIGLLEGFNNFIEGTFDPFNRKVDTKLANKDIEYALALTKNTDALSQNTQALLSSISEPLYEQAVTNSRKIGYENYKAIVDKEQNENKDYKLALSVLKNEMTEKDFKKYMAERNISEIPFFKTSDSFKQYDLLLGSGLEDFNGSNYNQAIKYLEHQIELNSKDLSSKKHKGDKFWYTIANGLSTTQEISDFFNKAETKKGTAYSLNSFIDEQYEKSDAAKADQQRNLEKQINDARNKAKQQKNYGMTGGFTWIPVASDKSVITPKELNELVSTNYSGQTINIDQLKMTNDDIKNIKSNFAAFDQYLTNAKDKDGNLIYGDYLQEFSNYRVKLNEASKIKNEKSRKQQVSSLASQYLEWINGIEDETMKQVFNTVMLQGDYDAIDEDKLNQIAEAAKKTYTDFWKRYSASVLGISVEGIGKGYSVASQYKNLTARSTNQAISKAMMTSGMSPEQALSSQYVQWGNKYTDSGRTTRGVDQLQTARNYTQYASSADSSLEVTQAYLNQLQSQESQMLEFFSGAAFKSEDLDKLYDAGWASALGYNNKESFVNAFSAELNENNGKFKETTLNLISAILEETRVEKENIAVISGLKGSISDLNSQNKELNFKNRGLSITRGTRLGSLDKDEYSSFLDKLYAAYGNNSAYKLRNASSDLDAFNNGTLYDTTVVAEHESNYQELLKKYLKEQHVIPDDLWSQMQNHKFDFAKNTNAEYRSDLEKQLIEANKVYQNDTNLLTLDELISKLINEIKENTKQQEISTAVEMNNKMISSPLSSQYTTYKGVRDSFDIFGILPDLKAGNSIKEQTALDFLSGGSWSKSIDDYIKDVYTKTYTEKGADGNDIIKHDYETLDIDKIKPVVDAYNKMKGTEFKVDDVTLDSLKMMTTELGNAADLAASIDGSIASLGQSLKETLKTNLLSGLNDTFKTIGESIAKSEDASEALANTWKDVATNILSSVGASMTETGLEIAAMGAKNGSMGTVLGGLALAAAGGVAQISAGMLGASDDDDDDDSDEEAERIQNLKDALSDLIDQAKTDAEYYQKNYLHRTALAANESYSSRSVSVNDAVITPSGNVINTAPDDYLIATKTPDTLMNNSSSSGDVTVEFNPTIKVVNQTNKEVEADVQQTTDENGNVEFDVVIKNVVAEAIANGDMDSAFTQRDYRINGRSVAW